MLPTSLPGGMPSGITAGPAHLTAGGQGVQHGGVGHLQRRATTEVVAGARRHNRRGRTPRTSPPDSVARPRRRRRTRPLPVPFRRTPLGLSAARVTPERDGTPDGMAGVRCGGARPGPGPPPRPGPRRRARPARAGRTGPPGGPAAGAGCPIAASTASGNLAGWAVARHTTGTVGSDSTPAEASISATPMPTAVCGSTSIPVRSCTLRTTAAAASSSSRPQSNSPCRPASTSAGTDTVPSARKSAMSRASAAPSRLQRLEQQPLQVGADLDVHRRAGGRAPPRVISMVPVVKKRVRMSLRLDADHQAVHGQPHPLGRPPGQDVAEVAGGHHEADRRPVRCDGQVGRHVVDDLRHDPGPVDGVDRGQPHLLPERHVRERGLDQVLAVVEGARHRDGVGVGRAERGHLAALHLGGPAVREQDEDVDVGQSGAGVHGRRAGVARGGAQDTDALVAIGEHVVEQPPDQLQRDVLEGERRSPEQLEQVQRHVTGLPERHDRAHRRRVEGGVGVGDDALEGRRGRCSPPRRAT